MKIPKAVIKFFQLLKQAILLIIGTTAGYLIIAILFSILPTHPPELHCTADKEIFITTNGIHLDFVLPVENIHPEFVRKLNLPAGTTFVSYGWGDKQFYINTPEWKDLTFSSAFNALFLKSETAMHVTCYSKKYSSWKSLKICDSQLEILNRYIENSFRKTETGSLKRISVKGYYDFDYFYEATGNFSLFKTCNIWVNKALKETGVKTSAWSPFDIGILYHLPK